MKYRRQPYPESLKFNEFKLKVSDIHELYVCEYGNPKGIPVIRFHGGPGSSSKAKHTTIFNPFKFRIIVFDQRGCGESTPAGCIEENTTQHLVDDIEKIRNHLQIDKWHVVGGSWGSCLALAYASKYPQSILSLIVFGVFAGRTIEMESIYENAKRFFPDIYEKYIEFVPENQKDAPYKYYQEYILNNVNPDNEILKRISFLEGNLMSLYPDPERLNLNYEFKVEDSNSLKIFSYYEKNHFFLRDDELINSVNIDKFRNIPAAIIQGRYDMVCSFETAWELHRLWPEAGFDIITDAGHHPEEPGITNSLLKWADKFSNIN
jgi:proline iminopeptidase